MASRHVVVDGSNIATEGRSMPSLAQLDTAVREFLMENPDDVVTVVVDASFGHRIDGSESKIFDEAEAAGEVVSPPAGAIGRGDAFLLRIADKTGATVLSNDSFQEFHGDYDWLFDRGRLVGGKPVPGVGWIFTPRTPVRGPRSREAVKEAKRKTTTLRRGDDVESAVPGLDLAAERARGKGKGKKTVERAIAVALEEAVSPIDKRSRRRKSGSPPAEPVNDPLAFITFIAAHPLGTEVSATVDSFSSHGAFVECEGARCYVPLSGMGDPPPKSAREVFTKGEVATFVLQALDPLRRGVELAAPGFAKIAGAPTEETVAAEIESRADEPAPKAAPARVRTGSRSRAAAAVEPQADTPQGAATVEVMAEATDGAGPAKRTRKKAGAPLEQAGAPVDQASPPEKPVAKRRGRKAPVDAVAPVGATAGQPAAAAATDPALGPDPVLVPVPAVEAPKAATRSRRAPAKRAPVAEPPATVTEPAPEAAPVARGRRPSPAKAAPPAKATPAKVAPRAKAAPAKAAPRAKAAPAPVTAAPVAPAPPAEAGAPAGAGAPAPAKRGRTKKVAVGVPAVAEAATGTSAPRKAATSPGRARSRPAAPAKDGSPAN